jgi:hypothetical protein
MNIGKKEACRTSIEQVKIIVYLALVFILSTNLLMLYKTPNWNLYLAESSLILSILFGFTTLGSIAGFQSLEKYDVYRPATRIGSILQLTFCVTGIVSYILLSILK